jgi:uncharacterized protein (TIGR02231 family)
MMPMPEMAPMAQIAEESSADSGISLGSVASAVGGAVGGVFTSSRSENFKNTPLNLLEPGYYQPPALSNPNLPALVAGGFDYVYRAPGVVSIPGNGQQVRVPIDVATYPVETFYEATPSLMTMAFLKATVRNKSGRPILKGHANIFVGGKFSGEGELATTGSGGQLELPLGADEDLRIVRTVVPATLTEGVFSKRDVTTYTVTIEVGNYKKRDARVKLTDQLPKTNNSELAVELVASEPTPSEGPDADGIMRWTLALPAGKTQKLIFTYTISRPANWQLTQ